MKQKINNIFSNAEFKIQTILVCNYSRFKKLSFCVALIFLFTSVSIGQKNNSTVLIKTIGGNIVDFETDNLGNIFLINDKQSIKKLNADYDSVGIFNDVRRYGSLYRIDASNPLKVLLFYKDFGTVLVLDRFLNIRSAIDLRQYGIFQCSAVAQSYDNNIWLFDEVESRIKKIDESGKLLLESPELRLVLDVAPHPTALVDYNKYLYAYDSTTGLIVLDYFGAYKNVIAFHQWKDPHGFSKGIVAINAIGLEYFEPGNISTETYKLPADILSSKKTKVYGEILYSLSQNGTLNIYKLK